MFSLFFKTANVSKIKDMLIFSTNPAFIDGEFHLQFQHF
jgi:hypothetical protein